MRKASQSAALIALCATAAAAALTGCGGPAREGYVAVGAVGPGAERGAGANVAPKGGVEFQPLPPAAGGSSASSDTSASSETSGPSAGTPPGAPGARPPGGSAPGGGAATTPGNPGAAPGTTSPGSPGTAPGAGGGPSAKPGTTPPAATPAKLGVGAPVRSAAAERWCEQVTVSFTNTGSTAARSGTVSFATHIIGALGVDWATITTTQPLPAPIDGSTTKTQTYRVCVESWRVPLGMHIETRKVTAAWS
ncbi:hypothetical protein ACODT3_19475 [Streptomyces sp. 4.24]|uniref:hypothetical protein n=1 Tax=Streptomyces tritrimontium TaxID=3406573 RepID=UPI003BB7032F